MSKEEQQQVNAMRAYFQRMCGHLADEGATAAALAESLAIKLKAANEELERLRPKPENNVVPITEPAA